MNEELNEVMIQEGTVLEDKELTAYEIAQRTYSIISVLAFTIMIVFIYKYLKNCLKFKK